MVEIAKYTCTQLVLYNVDSSVLSKKHIIFLADLVGQLVKKKIIGMLFFRS